MRGSGAGAALGTAVAPAESRSPVGAGAAPRRELAPAPGVRRARCPARFAAGKGEQAAPGPASPRPPPALAFPAADPAVPGSGLPLPAPPREDARERPVDLLSGGPGGGQRPGGGSRGSRRCRRGGSVPPVPPPPQRRGAATLGCEETGAALAAGTGVRGRRWLPVWGAGSGDLDLPGGEEGACPCPRGEGTALPVGLRPGRREGFPRCGVGRGRGEAFLSLAGLEGTRGDGGWWCWECQAARRALGGLETGPQGAL